MQSLQVLHRAPCGILQEIGVNFLKYKKNVCVKSVKCSKQDMNIYTWEMGRNGLPPVVEAVILDEFLCSSEAFAAEEDNLASVKQDATAATSSLSDNVLIVLFTAAALGLTILTAGVIYLLVTDFLDNRKNEAMKKEAEKKEKEMEKRAKKKAPEKARAGPRGFGQQPRKEDD